MSPTGPTSPALPTSTRAAVLHAPNDLRIETITLDPPGPTELIVKIDSVGLCHTDLHALRGDSKVYTPMVLGHEAAGTVVGGGAEASKTYPPGTRVALAWLPACGDCSQCKDGRHDRCVLSAKTNAGPMLSDGTFRRHLRAGGGTRGDGNQHEGGDRVGVGAIGACGAFAEYALVDAMTVIAVPDGLPLPSAALCACSVPLGLGAVSDSTMNPGLKADDAILVIGPGGDGMNIVQAARAAGLKTIIAADPAPLKRQLATSKFGATHALDWPSEKGRVSEILQQVGKSGLRAIYVCTPAVKVDNDLLALLAHGGDVVITALADVAETQVNVSFPSLVRRQLGIRGCAYGNRSHRLGIPLAMEAAVQGKIDVESLITREYTLDQILEGYDDLLGGKIMRGLVKPGGKA